MKLNKFKKIINQLIFENCLTFGNDPKRTSKRVTRYLLGTRGTTEIFKLYELRSLLLRVYPLIHNLFYNPRLSSDIETETFNVPNLSPIRKQQLKTVASIAQPKPWTKTISFWRERAKTLPPQILFATVTPDFADIIQSAAQICNMPFHKNRWWNGSITAAASYPNDSLIWNCLHDLTQSQIDYYFQRRWGTNKENPEKTKDKIRYYGRSRWPSLLIVPDISNNTMILKEAKKRGLPIIGLVNSDCTLEIDYPIFAQDQTAESIYFFCHFLAALIAKEVVYIQHKRYTLQQFTSKKANKKRTHLTEFMLQNNVFQRKNRQFQFEKLGKFKKTEIYRKKTFYFTKLQARQITFSSYKMALWKSFFQSFRAKERYKNYRLKMNYINLVNTVLRYWNYRHSKLMSFDCNKLKAEAVNSILFRNAFIKEQYFSYHVSWTANLTRHETQQKYFSQKKECFWTTKEKANNWNRILKFLFIKKMIRKQMAKKKYLAHIDASNNHYYWLALQQWHQDVKWQGHQHRNLKIFGRSRKSQNMIQQNWLESARKWKEHEAACRKQGKDPRRNDQFTNYKSKNYKLRKRHGKKSIDYKR